MTKISVSDGKTKKFPSKANLPRTEKSNYIIGIDEVGRGALAGIVTVGAVLMPAKFKIKKSKIKIPLKDSKKLSPKQREQWFYYIKSLQENIGVNQRRNPRQSAIYYAVANVSPKTIDKINISNAANLAAEKAVRKLTNSKFISLKFEYDIFLDGGLYLNKNKLVNLKLKNLKTIVRGDEKIPAIALASIVAKVSRDRYMKKLHKQYPRYDFINNVGYGTKKHIKALKRFSPSPIHRKSFKVR